MSLARVCPSHLSTRSPETVAADSDFPRLLGALEAARKGAGPAATAAAGTGGAGAGGKAGGFGGFGGAAMGK